MKSEIKILIHHHTCAYIENGLIYLQSFIGIWIDELSVYFDKIGLLFTITREKKPEQDYLIKARNVNIHILNPTGHSGRYSRNLHIKKVCQEVSEEYDLLIIRGITPRQKLVFENCKVKKRLFLFVGSLNDSRPGFGLSWTSLFSWILYKYRRWELKKIAKSAIMLANSPSTVKEILKILGCEATFIPTSSIRKEDFIPLEYREPNNPLRLLFCGRVVKDKGIEEAIEAVNILVSSGFNAELHVIGKYTTAYKIYLERKLRSHNLEGKVIFYGFLPFGKKILNSYRSSDIFILPSWHEGFAHSIWESAANCIPVIVTPVGGIPGILDKSHVLFCKKKDPKSIADNVINCIVDRCSTEDRIKALYDLSCNFTAEKCAEKLADIIYQWVH